MTSTEQCRQTDACCCAACQPPAVTLTNRHGTFTCTPHELDSAISRHLPASRNGLWTVMEEINPGADYSDVRSVSEFLVMLADAGEV